MSDVVDGLDVDVLIFVRFDPKRRVMWLFPWTRLQICLLYVVSVYGVASRKCYTRSMARVSLWRSLPPV